MLDGYEDVTPSISVRMEQARHLCNQTQFSGSCTTYRIYPPAVLQLLRTSRHPKGAVPMVSSAKQTILHFTVHMKQKQTTSEQEALLLCYPPPVRFGIRSVLWFCSL